jgi:ABC-type multidrug transport system ATPase subunit
MVIEEAVRAAIGVTGQFPALDNLLTGEENLLLLADLHHPNPDSTDEKREHE